MIFTTETEELNSLTPQPSLQLTAAEAAGGRVMLANSRKAAVAR